LLYLWVIWQHEGNTLPAEAPLIRQPDLYTNAADDDNAAYLKVSQFSNSNKTSSLTLPEF